jgi:hypothetical protein
MDELMHGVESEVHERRLPSLRPEVVIDALLHQQARIAGDIVEINQTTWAIHGSIPVDGEVILAEFDRRENAVEALAWLSEAEAFPPDARGDRNHRSQP